MHQTTIRFGPDTWLALEREAARLGVSAAQFVRDATLARLERHGGGADPGAQQAVTAPEVLEELPEGPEGVTSASAAVRSEARLVRRRSQRVRERSALLREERARGRPA